MRSAIFSLTAWHGREGMLAYVSVDKAGSKASNNVNPKAYPQ